MDIGLHISDDIAEDMRNTNGQDIARHILEAYVIQAYNNGNWGRRIGQGRRDQELQEVEPPCLCKCRCNSLHSFHTRPSKVHPPRSPHLQRARLP